MLNEVNYLGFVISSFGISPTQEKVKALHASAVSCVALECKGSGAEAEHQNCKQTPYWISTISCLKFLLFDLVYFFWKTLKF